MTYGAMQDRIADELARSDLTSQIQKAIQSAIKHYERQRFFFNEARSVTFSLSSSQEFYTASDHASIPNLLQIDAFTLLLNGTVYPVRQASYDEIEEMPGGTYDPIPSRYSYYGQQVRLYPVPSGGSLARVSGVLRLATPSATTDTNAWMTDAEELIRSRAEWDLYARVIRDPEMMMTSRALEQEALAAVTSESTLRMGRGRIKPTDF